MVKGRLPGLPPLVIVAWTQAVALAGWVSVFLVTGQPFTAPHAVWPAVVASAGLVTGMSGLLARASARGDISIVGPLLALSPVFTVLPDALLSGTLPSRLGWLGLALAVVGTMTLSGGVTRPAELRRLLGRGDARDALGAAVLLGVLAAVDRWGARTLGAPSYLLSAHGAAALLTTAIALGTTPRRLLASARRQSLAAVVGHGLLGAVGTGMQTTALTMAPGAHVNAIRRMSAVMAVVLGRALFREPEPGRRLAAALLALAGVACLLLAR